jgi:hypothetical protein
MQFLLTLIFQVNEFSSKLESPEIKQVGTAHIPLPKKERQQWQMERQRLRKENINTISSCDFR